MTQAPRRSFAIGLTSALAMAAVIAVGSPTAGASKAVCNGAGTSDFNGDGYEDVVIADPKATVRGAAEAGTVHIMYGAKDKPIGKGGGSTTLSQGDAAVGDQAESGDRFGSVVKVSDVDDDFCTDIIVGTPGEDTGRLSDTGQVHVIFGAPRDGAARVPLILTQASEGVPGTPEAGDQFGSAFDISDADTGRASLIVGSPGEAIGTIENAGMVTHMRLSGGKVTWAMNVHQDSSGVANKAEAGDRFGSAVAGEGNYDPDWHVFVGVPGESLAGIAQAGAVTDYTFEDGEVLTGKTISQNTSGVPGAAEKGDRFGSALASDDDLYGRDYVAVGAPGEDVGTATDAGLVQLFSGEGATATPYEAAFTQGTPYIKGRSETGDQFGSALALARFGERTRQMKLAIGTPDEDLDDTRDAGDVRVVTLHLGAPVDGQTITQDMLGGKNEAGDRFGAAVTFAGPAEDLSLVAGVPGDKSRPGGVAYEAMNSQTNWRPGQDGLPETGSSFGTAVGAGTR